MHPSTHSRRNQASLVFEILLLAGVYFLCGRFGLSLAVVHKSASAVWPPSGIALAVLLLRGKKLWPGVFIGAFLVNFSVQHEAFSSLGIAGGNCLEAVAGAWLTSRFAGGVRAFSQVRNLAKYVACAALPSTTLSPLVGVLCLCLSGLAQWQNAASIWATWWLGDLVSVLIVSPAIVLWAGHSLSWPTSRRALEAGALMALVAGIGFLVFLGKQPFNTQAYPLEYLTLPPLILIAFRFHERGAVTAALLMSVLAIWGTVSHFGPFARSNQNESLLLLQAFMGTITVTMLGLALVVSERHRAEQRLRVQDAVSRALAESTSLEEATPKIFQAMRRGGGEWEFGAIWRKDPHTSRLSCVEVWQHRTSSSTGFSETTRVTSLALGEGLPGRVWTHGEPAWVPDVTRDGNFPRAAAASEAGLHAAFCFPIKFDHQVVGALECFGRKIRSPDEHFLEMLGAIGAQLGQFIERKRAEKALVEAREILRQHTITLEKRVEERTAKLQETIQSLDGFCYSIAHDLRAPLRAVGGFSSELLRDYSGALDEPGVEYLKRIQAAAARMDQLILDLLKFGRLNTAELNAGMVDLEDLTKKVLNGMEAEIAARKAKVEVRPPLLPLQANATLTEQIAANLLGNALKFCRKGTPPRIEIWTEPHNDFIRLCVRDNGIGIRSDLLERLFQPFVRLVNGDDYPGTGIGLAIVRKAAERMGGRAGAESELGKGSCFWVELPAAAASRTRPLASAHKEGI